MNIHMYIIRGIGIGLGPRKEAQPLEFGFLEKLCKFLSSFLIKIVLLTLYIIKQVLSTIKCTNKYLNT